LPQNCLPVGKRLLKARVAGVAAARRARAPGLAELVERAAAEGRNAEAAAVVDNAPVADEQAAERQRPQARFRAWQTANRI
jgi:hypothetical protein